MKEGAAFSIREISFSEILPIWETQLWPGRKSPIEAISWITPEGKIDAHMPVGEPHFWGAFDSQNQLVGVMSGYRNFETYYRCRGVWVHEKYRRQKVATALMDRLVSQARQEKCSIVWIMPRVTSWEFYRQYGYHKVDETHEFEFGPHILGQLQIADASH